MHISEYDGGMKGRGFTLVELIIAIAVMAILLVLATLSFRNYQAAARDKEREADVLALQNYLESVYPGKFATVPVTSSSLLAAIRRTFPGLAALAR